MICIKCGECEYEEALVQYRMEANNKLYCFDDTPVLQCSSCEHIHVPEKIVNGLLSRIRKLSVTTFPYHRLRWDKFQDLESLQQQAEEEMEQELLGHLDAEEEQVELVKNAQTDGGSAGQSSTRAKVTAGLQKEDTIPAPSQEGSKARNKVRKRVRIQATSPEEFKAVLEYVRKNSERICIEKSTKKNILKSFKWNFDAKQGLKKDDVASMISDKIKKKEKGIFTYTCRAESSSGLDDFQYLLIINGETCFFYSKHDRSAPIWQFD